MSDYTYWEELGCLHRLEREQRWDLQGYCEWHCPIEIATRRARLDDRNTWEWLLYTGFKHIKFNPTIIDWENPERGIYYLTDEILLDKAS